MHYCITTLLLHYYSFITTFMPINLLPEKKAIKKPRLRDRIAWHLPSKEFPPKEIKPRKNYLLAIIVFFAIILMGGFILGYIYFKPHIVIVNNQNIEPSPSPSPIEPSPEPSPSPTPSPTFSPTPSPQPLPDTELSPLRGSVVRFADEPETLYLIEMNGELRWIDRQTVRFDNGQTINEISPNLIYTISNRYKYIRRGQHVYGLVDWDPRVLLPGELDPFK